MSKKEQQLPLMPKLTAVWLLENTTLTFKQISIFCGMHELEIQAIADGDVAGNSRGLNPVTNSQLTEEEIERCQKDPKATLAIAEAATLAKKKTKGARYTPISKRGDKPDAVAWLLRQHPELGDSQVVRLVGTTKNTIQAIREKSHWNTTNIKPRDPVSLGFCTQAQLVKEIDRANKRAENEAKAKTKAKKAKTKKAAAKK